MSQLSINYILFDYWEENWDPRSRGFWLANGGPMKIIMFIMFYLYFCLRLGPYLMKNRKPFELRKAMLFYNISTVLLNVYFFSMTIRHLNYGLELLNFKFPSRTVVTELDYEKARIVNFYIWTKLYDLTDTVFFVLRKKYNQITGLHLYHHAIVPLLCWVAFKIAPTASCLGVFPLFNTFVHIIMYSYYALSAMGPRVQPYLWWKRYITQLQLAQFVVYALYVVAFLRLQEGYPIKFWSFVAIPQPIIFFYLFYSFYKKSYTSKNNRNRSETTNNDGTAQRTLEGQTLLKTNEPNNMDQTTNEQNNYQQEQDIRQRTRLLDSKSIQNDKNNNNPKLQEFQTTSTTKSSHLKAY